ncbi:AraC family transcriptional regulator [Ferrimonas pelagia]|uniref:HTH araC/xylS-type domain-containing protein n=1 Tax=Ferrimonas pelagia TaxID=1177826 RepID=A0ABP9ENX7_9GAMM
MTEYLVPARYARLLLKVAIEQGYDINELLALAELPFNPLELDDDEELEISALTFSKLYRRISMMLQDEAFGLGTRYRFPPGTFRMMCYCIIHAPNLQIALERTTEFYALCHELKGNPRELSKPYRLSGDGKDVTLFYSSYAADNGASCHPSRQLTLLNSLSLWHRFCSWLIGTNIAVHQVGIPGPQVLSRPGYRYYFDCPIEFTQPQSTMIFSAHYLKAPLVHNEESLEQFLETAPFQLFTLSSEAASDSIIPRIRALIGYNFTKKIPSFDEMASLLNTSSRTLRRRLESEGTSYQQIKDDCRRDAAIEYLSRSELSINAVAALMGFDEPSAFHRSFKKWTHITPGEFRRRGLPEKDGKDAEAAVTQ